MKKRSECTCSCHHGGSIHIVPCCFPDEMVEEIKKENDSTLIPSFWEMDLEEIEGQFLPEGTKITDLPIQNSVDGIPVADENEYTVASCDSCGGKRVLIRGKYPQDDKRVVCPTCITETLDDITDRLSPHYGKAKTNNNEVE